MHDAANVVEERQTKDFQLALSFDMSYAFRTENCPTNKAWDVATMTYIVKEQDKRSSSYRWNSSVLIMTHEGGLYGGGFFKQLADELAEYDIDPTFAPYVSSYSVAASKSSDPDTSAQRFFSDYSDPTVSGYFNGLAWPNNVRENITCFVDTAFKDAIEESAHKGPFIMGVSPWQYENLNTPNPAGSWVQYSDTLYSHRWNQAITDVQPDIVNILSWNDYIASTYLREVPEKTGPGSVDLGEQGNYVYGMNHTAWGAMTKYFSKGYMTDNNKPEITDNDLIYWYRTHRKDATCKGGRASASTPVRNSDFVNDSVFIWAKIRSAVTVEVYFGTDPKSRSERPGTPRVTFDTTGQTEPFLLELPFPDDFPANSSDKLYPQVVVNPDRIAYSKYDSVPITGECDWENFNAVVQSLGSDFNDLF
ncbi:glycoside hydrolase family 71 protein [Aplosporella prunicola CBS 121167]|uniref:Glycoside hydrolase family 71 protein n=1 Tax=Aplosporella prunicola CBS 121167 TaxID=1176127 RepID=A0A6A6B6R1_9PEZI|nr:glycoside hydrolase family 71 protein [Aplosporella prunicola CBS 121167]KAF2138481.1 glycoside hydrolase family 71 protein [Aplosporella prunicola CBS 121167]